jgi:hypothetical protein
MFSKSFSESVDDGCLECTNADIVMPFPEVFPLAHPQTLPLPFLWTTGLNLFQTLNPYRSLLNPEQMQVAIEKLLGPGFIRPRMSPWLLQFCLLPKLMENYVSLLIIGLE